MVEKVYQREKAQNILASGKSDDLKLFEIFKIYSEDLQKEFSQLYYALLGWKDNHLKELSKEKPCGNSRRLNTETFWASAIIYNKGDTKPWLCAMTTSQFSLKQAMIDIECLKGNNNVLSAWVDMFDINNTKKTVFHECYM